MATEIELHGRWLIRDYLKRSWTPQLVIRLQRTLRKRVPAEIHNEEVVAEESRAVCPSRESDAAHAEGTFTDQVKLVLLLYRAGVSRGVDERCPNNLVTVESRPARVAKLQRRAFALEVNAGRKQG